VPLRDTAETTGESDGTDKRLQRCPAKDGMCNENDKERTMSQTYTPPPQSAPQNDCGCPSESGSNTCAQQAAIISADIDAGTSGIKLMTDVLGHDFIDASVNLGAVDGVLDTVLGLTDTGTGLLDGLLCDVV
jgi:hypothetical protein